MTPVQAPDLAQRRLDRRLAELLATTLRTPPAGPCALAQRLAAQLADCLPRVERVRSPRTPRFSQLDFALAFVGGAA